MIAYLMVFYLVLMSCVICVKQTSLTWPHFFSYSYYLVLYYFVFYLIIPQSTVMDMYSIGAVKGKQGLVA